MEYANRYLSPVLAFVAFLLAAGTPASATYPGKNGRIAFIAGPDVYTMNPDGSDVKELTNLGPDNNGAFLGVVVSRWQTHRVQRISGARLPWTALAYECRWQ